MRVQVLADADLVAQEGATFIADAARSAIENRGRFVCAVSGGRTPWVMFRALAQEHLRWDSVHVLQVDERIAPANDPDRNLKHLRDSLLSHAPLPAQNIHAMPVERDDVDAAASDYARTVEALAGSPPALDLVHLGLGPDGHTASLVPGDPVLDVMDALVGTTCPYQGRRRMTLTYPALNHALGILFIVTGAEKVDALARLVAHDQAIPAGRVDADNAVVIADQAAAVGL